MTGFIETAVITAIITLSGGWASEAKQHRYAFDNPGVAAGDRMVAIVQVHNSIGPFPAQAGWTKLGEISSQTGGPRVAAFYKTRIAGETGYVLKSAKSTGAKDARASGVLVGLGVPAGYTGTPTLQVFDSIAYLNVNQPYQYVEIPVGSVNQGDLFVWLPTDNTEFFNSGNTGYVAPANTSIPVHTASSTEPTGYLTFEARRHDHVPYSQTNYVVYAGAWIKFPAPVSACRR